MAVALKDEKAMMALESFAIDSSACSEATGVLCGYPKEKVQDFLEKLSTDRDHLVRQTAKRCVASYQKR